MAGKKWAATIFAFSAITLIALAFQRNDPSGWFVEYPLPLKETYKLMDVGVVDASGDNLLDIYTSNHNFRQMLLIADSRGSYHNVLDEWGLSQSPQFPGVELSYIAPETDKARLYIYWLGRGGNDKLGHNVIVRVHKADEIGDWKGTLQINAPVELAENDGRLDVFISRGALGGGLSQYPENVQRTIKDSFFVSESGGSYKETGSELGFAKKGCSWRHIKWVDFDQDGLLDQYINCQDRGRMERNFPKQLYRQDKTGRFVDVAAEVGLAIPDHQLVDFMWLDADNDGDADLLATEDTGFYLYRNRAGHFSREFIGRGTFARDDRRGLKYVTLDYWNFDGKLTIADYDADGDLDAFPYRKEGNTLLVNDSGKYSLADPTSIGLPPKSVDGNWVDYDNDGLPDFHAVPEGLFQQQKDHHFKATGLLVLQSHKYLAAISNWADLDNDGARDVLIALNENPSLWRWWENSFKSARDVFRWTFLPYRNIGADKHWLQVKLEGNPGNRQAIGASVTVVTPDGQQMMEVGSHEGAFFSQGHYRLYFGLGQHKLATTVKIRWPDGSI